MSLGREIAHTVAQVWRFGVVSLVGLALDTCVFLALVAAGVRPLWANAVGGTLAVTFVYFASVRRIFYDRSRFIAAKFAVYLLYQAVAVLAASAAVDLLVYRAAMAPIVAKLAIIPVTFGANYLFMRWLTAQLAAR